jgi:hypothetical protein
MRSMDCTATYPDTWNLMLLWATLAEFRVFVGPSQRVLVNPMSRGALHPAYQMRLIYAI